MLVLVATVVLAKDSPSAQYSLTVFDEEVAVCRRLVRNYCAIVQNMASSPTIDKNQQADGLRLLSDARKQWAAIQSKYSVNPPEQYAKDQAFKARLSDFANALEDMERALGAGDARRSFNACSFGCGLFVSMHEQNGLNYALDKLYHLRSDLKTSAVVMKTQGMDALRMRMPGLLQKRDAVLLAPPPFPPNHEKANAYMTAVEELSHALDRLAQAIAAGDKKQIKEILTNALMLVNKPYGIAL